MAEMNYNIIKSEQGKDLIVHNNFCYYFQKLLANEYERWPCVKRDCRAYLRISPTKILIPEDSNFTHIHAALTEKELKVKTMNSNLKSKSTENLSASSSSLIRSELRKTNIPELDMIDIVNFRRNISRWRLKVLPNIPKTMAEFHTAAEEMQLLTNRDERLLQINDATHNIICFSTITNLRILCSLEKVSVDGTFYSCPKPFAQIFCIHGKNNNIYTPLVFFLLPNKITYEKAFSLLKIRCTELGLNFQPTLIRSDFEKGILNAVEGAFGGQTRRAGCRFHLGQNWYRRIQKVGLAPEYADETSEVTKTIKQFFGLPFLPPSDVEAAFNEIMSQAPVDAKLNQLAYYINKNYIMQNSIYPPCIWAEYSRSNERTTNNCESFHSKLNNMFTREHPNLIQLCEALLDIQCDIYVKLDTIGENSQFNVEREQFLARYMGQYERGRITRAEFVKTVSLKFLPNPTI